MTATAATLHLISGLPCSGKSTYALRVRDQRDAVLLSLDHWLITSFGRYPVDVVGHDEHLRRVYACRELIWGVAAEFLRRRSDVVLDDGFFLRCDREHHIRLARDLGAAAVIHFVETPARELRRRLVERNRNPGIFQFSIAPAALAGYTAIFERPSADEGAEVVSVSGGG